MSIDHVIIGYVLMILSQGMLGVALGSRSVRVAILSLCVSAVLIVVGMIIALNGGVL